MHRKKVHMKRIKFGFKAKTLEDAKRMAIAFADSVA
nr:MAG TPA: hypothetical protein [Caudoviricetes sp.]